MFALAMIMDLLVSTMTVFPVLGADGDKAEQHICAAENAAKEYDLEPTLLLAVAAIESNFDPNATSRVVNGRRVTGSWPSTRPTGQGPRFCGVLQTIAGNKWNDCLAQRDLDVGYMTGAKELRDWLTWTKGNLKAALRGHACGVPGATGKVWCKNYENRVLKFKRALDHELAKQLRAKV